MIVAPLRLEHVRALRLQQAQEPFACHLTQEYVESLIEHGRAWAVVDDNTVVACAGFVEQWSNRAYAWALIGSEAGRRMVAFTRIVRRFLDESPWPRIETAVDEQFEAGHRWAVALGFTKEGVMRHYSPDGRDCALYGRVRWKP